MLTFVQIFIYEVSFNLTFHKFSLLSIKNYQMDLITPCTPTSLRTVPPFQSFSTVTLLLFLVLTLAMRGMEAFCAAFESTIVIDDLVLSALINGS